MAFSFSVKKREEQRSEDLRTGNVLPGVLYGAGSTPVSISTDYKVFETLLKEAGESSLIDVTVEGNKEPIKALIQDIQVDPVKRRIIHFDLRQINMNKEMEVEINLNFIGEAPAVKTLGGTLVKMTEVLAVKCLPKDLVSEVNVDLGVLNTFDDIIRLKDIILPAGIKADDDPEKAIAKVLAPLTEEQLKAMEEEGPKSVEEVEVEKKGKEEVAEGEAEGKKE